ncbi:hypothetical protein BH09MYX1_BH09MYX1_58630 [soil metagenome]
MHTPYTPNPGESFIVAQTALGVTGAALVWVQRRALGFALPLFVLAIVCSASAPSLGPFVLALHGKPAPDLWLTALRVGAWCTLGAAIVARGSVVSKVLGIAVFLGLRAADGYLVDSAFELCTLHLGGTLLAAGACARNVPPTIAKVVRNAPREHEALHDVALFAAAVLLAWVVGRYVLRSGIDSSDESAYVFQAHVFAKLRSYSDAAPCGSSFQNFWIFDWQGRRFSQYTPGWPLFLVPFVWLRALPLAAPVSFGFFVVAAARVARRLVPEASRATAGVIAGASLAASSTCLINGGSYFSHVWVAACFLWSIEALFASGEATTARARALWGAAFGLFLAWMVATRPSDGVLLGGGLFLLFVFRAVQRRVPAIAFGFGALIAAAFGAWTLWVLHRQLGTWFTTGYSLTGTIHPWVKLEFQKPEPEEWKWGIPLGTGAYCWFPASPVLALFGFAMVRGRNAVAIVVAFACSAFALFAFYSYLNFGRGFDWGYGPRYVLPSIAVWAVGTGAALGQIAIRVRSGSRTARVGGAVGPWVAATAIATFLLAPLLYPMNTDSVMKLQEVSDRAKEAGLHHALVFVSAGVGERGPLDYTINQPIDLYPNQNILVAQPTTNEDRQCLRSAFPDRSIWEARGNPIHVDPAQ